MMPWPDRTEERAQQEWRARFAKERRDLSASVEETLVDSSLPEDLLLDQHDDEDERDGGDDANGLGNAHDFRSGSRSVAIIPPKLSLQSKAMPVVRVEPPGSANVMVIPAPAVPAEHPVETPARGQKKQRLAGRTTKVRLQAVPKTEKKSGGRGAIGVTGESNVCAIETGPQTEAVDKVKRISDTAAHAGIEGRVRAAERGRLAGTGVFERGQGEVTMANAVISATSVVVVTLTGDPGPVVIQYVTLQPQAGFTVHLSAPAMRQTPFNYVILLGELF